jgi:Serine/threonine protein phosphatase
MENTTRISCSAVTHVGTGRAVNDDRIYINGKFLNTFEYDNSNVSLEINSNQFIFALSDGMDTGSDEVSRISINDDLKKLHQKVKNSSKDIQVKLDEMADCVQQSSNLIYSMSLGGEMEKEWNASFGGIVIDNGSIGAVNLGKCKIYKLEADNLRLLMDDYRKTERLLKMGIISDEQAELISGRKKSTGSDNNLKVRKSEIFKLREGSVYLLCSDGLVESVSEDSIYEILAENEDTDVAAGLLINEAINNGGADNITAMVIKIEKTSEATADESIAGSIPRRRIQSVPARSARNGSRLDMKMLVTTCIAFVVIAAVVFGGFTLWKLLRNPESDKHTSADVNATDKQTVNKSTAPGNDTDEEGTVSSITTETTAADINNSTEVNKGTVIDENTTYTVQSGDSLSRISKKFYGDDKQYKKIMEANNITDPKRIQVGQVLKIPPLN